MDSLSYQSKAEQFFIIDDFFNLDIQRNFSSDHYPVQTNEFSLTQNDNYQNCLNFQMESSEYPKYSMTSLKTQSQLPESFQKQCCKVVNPKIKKSKQKYHTETKNLTKFFGSKLFEYCEKNINGQRNLKRSDFTSLKGLRIIWRDSEEIRKLSKGYFESVMPIIDVMSSNKISDKQCAIRYISSFLRGIEEPENFQRLKWSQ